MLTETKKERGHALRRKIKSSSFFQRVYQYCGIAVLCFLLVLAFVNLYGRGPIFYFLFCFSSIIIFLLKSINPIVRIQHLWPYIILTLGSCLAAVLYYDMSMLIKAICPILSFIIGYNIHHITKKRFFAIKCITYSILTGLFLIFVITYYFNYFVLGVQPGERVLTDIWTMEIGELPITIFSLYSSFIIGLTFYLIFVGKHVIEIIVGVLLLGFTLYVNAEAASRSPFLILVVVYVTLFFPYLKFIGKNKTYKKRFIGISICLGICLLFFAYQLLGQTNREESALEARMEQDGLESSRTDLAASYFSLMFEYPLGGGFAEKEIQKKAHNFIQECHDIFGIGAFISLVFICISLAKQVFRVYMSKHIISIDLLFLGIISSVLLQCLLEPIFSAYPQLMWCLFLYHGMLLSYLRGKRKMKKKNKRQTKDTLSLV